MIDPAADPAFWRAFWTRFGPDSTSIVGTGYRPHERTGPHDHYPAVWHPDDHYRDAARHRRMERP